MTIDQGALRAIGNGRILGYFSGPHLAQLFGPTYSSPDLLSLTWSVDDELEWTDQNGDELEARLVRRDGSEISILSEATTAALTYRWKATRALHGTARSGSTASEWHAVAIAGWSQSAVLHIPRGGLVYQYPTSREFFVVVCSNDAIVECDAGGLSIISTAARGSLSVVVGDDFHRVMEEARSVAGLDERQRYADSLRALDDRIGELKPPGGRGSASPVHWYRSADQILAQQSLTGGFMAGHRYALAYLRDQFGTCEGLLALGLYEAVKRNIEFRLAAWRRFGDLANAESMSSDDIRHHHENDDVEQTGYMVLQILNYVDASGDEAILESTGPLIAWCVERQHENLVGGSIPFNGDETYVAGGVLPRWALADGSLEATILYGESLRRLMLRRNDPALSCIDFDLLATDLDAIREAFRTNFDRNGALITNSTTRRSLVELPASRRGVCENCLRFPTTVIRLDSDRYRCFSCIGIEMERRPTAELAVTSSTLIGYLLAATVVPEDLQRSAYDAAKEEWSRVGFLTSAATSDLAVGYDEGLLLRGALALGDLDFAAEVAVRVAAKRDRFGTWSEFYEGLTPVGTRCRPWETGMNLAALAAFYQVTAVIDERTS
jgi:hypothetical protein